VPEFGSPRVTVTGPAGTREGGLRVRGRRRPADAGAAAASPSGEAAAPGGAEPGFGGPVGGGPVAGGPVPATGGLRAAGGDPARQPEPAPTGATGSVCAPAATAPVPAAEGGPESPAAPPSTAGGDPAVLPTALTGEPRLPTAERPAGPVALVPVASPFRTVGDLVEAAGIPSVVSLADLADPLRRRSLARAFLADPALLRWLGAFAEQVAAGRGRAWIVQGPYGAGKSHLLAAIAIWASGEALPGLPGVRPRPARPPAVAAVSLIAHAADEPLEAVMRGAIAEATGLKARLPALLRWPRAQAFAAIRQALGGRGLVVLLDELSEFLRSKPAGPSLTEDVRFLQFLAEWASTVPAHVVAALNEPLAASLYLAPDLRRRLGDRFPASLALGEAHLADLIARRLRHLRPGARPWLLARYAELRRAFGPLPFTAEAFVGLYPFHPQTVAWLHDLRGLLSAQRGAVDFACATLAGDPARGIAPFLDRPAGSLVCPDDLCDHFLERLREIPATEALAAVVLPALARDAAAVFPDPEPRDLAVRAAKLLALAAAAEPPRRLGAREVTLALLHRLTDLGPGPNHEFAAAVLARLAAAGAYVAAEAAPARDEPLYRLDAQLDAGLQLSRLLAHARAEASRDGLSPFGRLAAWCDDPDLPLARLCQSGETVQEIPWRGSRRVVRLVLSHVDAPAEADLRRLLCGLETSEADAAVILVPPVPGEPERSRRAWSAGARRLIAATHPRALVFCWLPREPSPAEAATLLDALAHARLADAPPEPAEVRDRLAAALAEARARVRAVYRALYAEGAILGSDGPADQAAGLPPGERLAGLLGAALARRFPRHPELRLPATHGPLLRALRVLCREGRSDGGQAGASALLEAYLPFGLVTRTADGGVRLRLEPAAAPVLGEIQAALRGASPDLPLAAPDLYARLRRAPYGLQRRAFETVMLLVVGAGIADLCRGGRRLAAEKLVADAIWEADGLAPGEILAPGPAATLASLPWLPERLRQGPLTQAAQREAWTAVREWCAGQAALVRECQDRLQDVGQLPSARTLAATAAEDLRRLGALAAAGAGEAVAPAEGLLRFVLAWEGQAEAAALVARCRDLRRFLAEGFDRHLWMAGYLEAAGGAMAADDPLQAQRASLAARMLAPVGAWAELQAAFEAFRAAYAASYQAAHTATVGEAVTRPYRAIRGSPAGAVATALSGLPATESPVAWAAVERQLEAALAGGCAVPDAELAERLRRTALCGCGFRPRQPVRRPPAEAIAADAERSARGYVASLAAPPAEQRLRAHMAGLRAVGRAADAERLAAFLRRAPRAALADVAEALAGETGVWIREALEGQLVVLERDPAELAERLRGRVLVPDGVLAEVRAWLAGVPPGGFVRMAGRTETPPASAPGGWRQALAALAEPGAVAVVVAALWDGAADPGEVERLLAAEAGPASGTCRAAARVVRALEAVRRGPPADAAGWEALWSGPAARGQRELGRLRLAAAEAGPLPLPALSAWEAEWAQATRGLRAAFARVRPGEGIEALWRRMALADARHLWWLDAMRADLADDLLEAVAGLVSVRERGLLWARLPTTTEAQLAALRAAGCELPLLTWREDAAEAVGPAILRWPFLDDRVHTSREPYGELAAGFAEQCRHRVRPALAALPAGTEVWLFSDHGFAESPGRDGPRYLHGGGSPEEVLVPWLRLVRA
jgi:hypothetical protein